MIAFPFSCSYMKSLVVYDGTDLWSPSSPQAPSNPQKRHFIPCCHFDSPLSTSLAFLPPLFIVPCAPFPFILPFPAHIFNLFLPSAPRRRVTRRVQQLNYVLLEESWPEWFLLSVSRALFPYKTPSSVSSANPSVI